MPDTDTQRVPAMPNTDKELKVDLNGDWNEKAKPPELFEHWWAKNGDKNWSVKHAAREGWYACAESLGVYDNLAEDSRQ